MELNSLKNYSNKEKKLFLKAYNKSISKNYSKKDSVKIGLLSIKRSNLKINKSYKRSSTVFKTFHEAKAKHWEEDGEKYASFIVSGVRTDGDGQAMSRQACDSMINDLRSGAVKFQTNHGEEGRGEVYDMKDMVGWFVDGEYVNSGLDIMGVARITTSTENGKTYWDLISEGAPLQYSIGGEEVI